MLKEEVVHEVEQNERYTLYRKKFARLGADCQKLLGLFLDKVSMAEIMTRMGFGSVSYTKKRKFYCKKKLIELIEKDPVSRSISPWT